MHALATDRTERKASKGKPERDLIELMAVMVGLGLEGALEAPKSKAYKAMVMMWEGYINRLCTIWIGWMGVREEGERSWADVRNDDGVRWGRPGVFSEVCNGE